MVGGYLYSTIQKIARCFGGSWIKLRTMTWSQSEKLFAQALGCISGGVNSPVRAFVRVEHGLMAGEFFLKP